MITMLGKGYFLENGTFESCACKSNAFSAIFHVTMK